MFTANKRTIGLLVLFLVVVFYAIGTGFPFFYRLLYVGAVSDCHRGRVGLAVVAGAGGASVEDRGPGAGGGVSGRAGYGG